MKIKILLASLSFFALSPLAFASVTYTVTVPTGVCTPLPNNCCDTGFANILCSPSYADPTGNGIASPTWNIVSGSFPYTILGAFGGLVTISSYTVVGGGGGGNAFITQLGNATTTFQATTGFDIAGVVSWAGDNLIKLFIGSGLAVLLALRGWIVALVIIGAIVYFAYRAFRFFRH